MSPGTAELFSRGFLIADDKSFLRNMIQNMLLRHRVRNVMHASNGAEAMTMLAKNRQKIDCVLSDWNMEPVDGLDLLRCIRAGRVLHTPRELRVVMLTGHADEPVVTAALAMDANGYVIKPVSIQKLIDAIDKAFSRPTALKSVEAYMSADIMNLPDDLPGGKRTPAWVLLHDEENHEREVFVRQIEGLRRDAAPPEPGGEGACPPLNLQYTNVFGIRPGSVLAENIYTGEGKLLLGIGTALTEALLTRLRDLAAGTAENAHLLIGQGST